MPARRVPKYRWFKPKNLGLVVIEGRQHYLGRYGTPESLAKYHALVQEYLTRPPESDPTPAAGNPSITVGELILAFWKAHLAHYRHPDGTPTGELDNYRDSLRPLHRLYGELPAREFTPLLLKELRKSMINANLARSTINQRIGRVVRMFKWCTSEELVPVAVYEALRTVSGLPRNRSEARESPPIGPVDDAYVNAIQPFVARQVWAMVELQRLSGMRPGEVVLMRSCDLDREGDVWFYSPSKHKTAHHGKTRRIALGPRAQDVIRPWLESNSSTYLFSPRDAMAEFRAEQRRRRKTRLYPCQAARKPSPSSRRRLGDRYTTRSYHHAVRNACRRAGIPPWHPNQIRHTLATRIRHAFDLESARAVLGHSDLKTSEIYAERDSSQAASVMRQIG